MNFILELMIRPLVRALTRLFDGPQKPYNPYEPIEKYMDDLAATSPTQPEQGDDPLDMERKPYDPPISSEALASKPPHGWFEHLVNRPETPGRRALATEAWLRGYTYGALTRATQPEHVDIEKLIHDTVARWHGDQFDRRPLAKVLTETLRPYLKKPAGHQAHSGSDDF